MNVFVPKDKARDEEDNDEPLEIINIIVGGPELVRDERKRRK